jgi:hypothetical protein
MSLSWCKKMKREYCSLGAYIGEFGCYRPDDDVVCIGLEQFSGFWLNEREGGIPKLIGALIDTLIHEGIHRAIFKVTSSRRACLHFDLLFTPFFNFKANREYFKRGEKHGRC